MGPERGAGGMLRGAATRVHADAVAARAPAAPPHGQGGDLAQPRRAFEPLLEVLAGAGSEHAAEG